MYLIILCSQVEFQRVCCYGLCFLKSITQNANVRRKFVFRGAMNKLNLFVWFEQEFKIRKKVVLAITNGIQ